MNKELKRLIICILSIIIMAMFNILPAKIVILILLVIIILTMNKIKDKNFMNDLTVEEEEI